MRYESAFEVAGLPAEVLETFADLPTVASFLPGASVGPANPDGSHPGTLVVSFGPKKLAFRGKVENKVERETLSGVVSGMANADVRGARMAVTMRYQLAPATARPGGTRVGLVSDAELTGMLAEFAKTGGVVLANAVLADFAARLSAHFEARAAAAASASTAASMLASMVASTTALPLASTPASAPASTPASTPAATMVATAAPSTLSASTLAGAVLRAFAAACTHAIARAITRIWRALVGGRN